MEIQEFVSGRPEQQVILGGDFNASLYGMTDYFHVEESNPRPRTLVDTNDSLRARASHDGGRTGLDGDEHVDECRHRTRALHTIQLVKSRRFADTNGFHHDFEKIGNETCADTGLRLVQDGSQSGSCCLFVETEMRYTLRNGMNLRGWEPDEAWLSVAAETLTDWENWNAMVPLLMETAMAHRKVETKEMSVTEMELKSLLLKSQCTL